MLSRFRSLFVSSIVLLSPMAAEASPITYAFTGTLNQAVNGSNQFSGSFTIDSNPMSDTNYPVGNTSGVVGANRLSEGGPDVSVTVRLGNQIMHYINSTQTPSLAYFSATWGDSGVPNLPPPSVHIEMSGGSPLSTPWSFYLSLARSGANFTQADLANLASPAYTSSVEIGHDSGGQWQYIQGTLNSIQEVSAPEPGSLAIFGGLAVAAMITARRRAACRTGADGRREGPRASRG